LENAEHMISAFVLKSGRPGILHPQLMNLLYLTDLMALGTWGSPLTNLHWIHWNHGPFSEDLNDIEKSLQRDEKLLIREGHGHPNKTYPVLQSPADFSVDLFPRAQIIVDRVWSDYGNLSLSELLAAVYETEPIKKTQDGAPIEFTMHSSNHGIDDETQPWIYGGTQWGE